MNDMTPVIAPKSDQLTADDLIGGPRTITITEVMITPGTEQPVAIHFKDDDGRPYRSCKSMNRVLVYVWGPDAAVYSGRSLTLYRDPKVLWGGMPVGGIRISHMSHIEQPVTVVLTETKKSKKPFRVLPLKVEAPKPAGDPAAAAKAASAEMVAFVDALDTAEALAQFETSESANKRRKRLAEAWPDLARDVDAAVMAARSRTTPKTPITDDDVPF